MAADERFLLYQTFYDGRVVRFLLNRPNAATDTNRGRLSVGTPAPTTVLEVADQFLLLGINRDRVFRLACKLYAAPLSRVATFRVLTGCRCRVSYSPIGTSDPWAAEDTATTRLAPVPIAPVAHQAESTVFV